MGVGWASAGARCRRGGEAGGRSEDWDEDGGAHELWMLGRSATLTPSRRYYMYARASYRPLRAARERTPAPPAVRRLCTHREPAAHQTVRTSRWGIAGVASTGTLCQVSRPLRMLVASLMEGEIPLESESCVIGPLRHAEWCQRDGAYAALSIRRDQTPGRHPSAPPPAMSMRLPAIRGYVRYPHLIRRICISSIGTCAPRGGGHCSRPGPEADAHHRTVQ